MLAARILSHHGRCHETAATSHVHNHTPTSPLASRFDILFHHYCRLCAGAEEHPEDVHIHETLKIGEGGALDGSRVTDADLNGETRNVTCQIAIT